MYCKNCGKILRGDERFCSYCGKKVEYDTPVNLNEDEVNQEVDHLSDSNMVWDLDDFEDHRDENAGKNGFSWDSDEMYKPGQDNLPLEGRDEYKGPLMFRKEDKAPSKEEIEKREKEEESTKKSTLYAEDRNLAEGARWDISNVEIPEPYVPEEPVADAENEKEKDGLSMELNPAEPVKDVSEPKTKEEIQAVIDDAIEKVQLNETVEDDESNGDDAEDSTKKSEPAKFDWGLGDDFKEDFEPIIASPKNAKGARPKPKEMVYDEGDFKKVEPKKVVLDWNKEVEIPRHEEQVEEPATNEKLDEKEEPIIEEPAIKEEPKVVTPVEPVIPEEDNVIDRVLEEDMSMTLEELVAGSGVEGNKVPESNYDESRKTIRNVLSKNAIKQEPSFLEETLDEDIKPVAPEVKIASEPPVAPVNHKEHTNVVVGIEQPKTSNISLKIEENESGEKVEKLLEDDPKAPTEFKGAEPKKAPVVEETVEKELTEEEIKAQKEKERFYTFNKSKEEFQKLLDKEYRRLEGDTGESKGYEEDVEGFMEVHRGKGVEATSQIEEMNKARSVFISGHDYGEISVLEEEDYEKAGLDPNILGEDKKEPEEELAEMEVDDIEIPAEVEVEEYDDEEPQEMVENPSEDAEKVTVVFEPEKDESLAETFIENEQAKEQAKDQIEDKAPVEDEKEAEAPVEDDKSDKKTDYLEGHVSKMMIDPNEKLETERLASEFFDHDDEDEKGGAKKFFLGLLSIIVVIAVAIVGIKFIIPDSPIAKVMDEKGGKVMETINGFIGGDKESNNKPSVRDSAMEDKTELIAAQMSKNYNENIKKIEYDKDLDYSSDATYDLEDLHDAKDIQTILWYKDSNNNPHYYDEEIVGTIIEFVSMKHAWISSNDKAVFSALKTGTDEYRKVTELETGDGNRTVDMLAIGDIKVAGNSYYVWASETTDGETKEYVYEIKEQDQKLYINNDCEI